MQKNQTHLLCYKSLRNKRFRRRVKWLYKKNRKTRSKRGMRRSHDALSGAALSVDQTSGETHLRHHVTADGYYKGKKVIA